MVGDYELTRMGKPCWHVTVEKQGLYYHISCRCRLPAGQMYCLTVICGDRRENLGVCVPMDGQFGAEKRIPCKRLGEGTPEFTLLPKHEKPEGKFLPVFPEEPFPHLSRLGDAHLENRAGQLGIVIRE